MPLCSQALRVSARLGPEATLSGARVVTLPSPDRRMGAGGDFVLLASSVAARTESS